MEKRKELIELMQEIESCELCKKDSIGKMVFGEGNINPKIMFVGEAPGKQEAKIGRPFIGRSGMLLRKLILEIGLTEEGVYITSPVKYLPERGTPSSLQIKHARSHFQKQLDVLNPKLIVLLGKTAVRAVLDTDTLIHKEHGSVSHKNGRAYFITFHPAAGLRFPPLKVLLVQDFKKLKLYIKDL